VRKQHIIQVKPVEGASAPQASQNVRAAPHQKGMLVLICAKFREFAKNARTVYNRPGVYTLCSCYNT
jgi:hypothetical protein